MSYLKIIWVSYFYCCYEWFCDVLSWIFVEVKIGVVFELIRFKIIVYNIPATFYLLRTNFWKNLNLIHIFSNDKSSIINYY